MKIETSKVFTQIRKANTRVLVLEGSSRSSKTFSIIQYLIYKCIEKKRRITACRAMLTWIRRTAMLDFLSIMPSQFSQIWSPKNWSKTAFEYTFGNGSVFSFMGLDDPQKAHGYKGDIVWLNEGIEVEQNAYTQLAMRTTDQIIIDYNPSAETHWIYDSVIPRDDCTFIKSTYKDNPFLEQAIIQEIERLRPSKLNDAMGTSDETLWKIYGLGERASHKGLIFKDINVVKALPPREEWKKNFFGLDFGFTNDPTALVIVVYAHGELWFQELVYEKGLVNRKNDKMPQQKSIEQRLEERKVPKNAIIYADSAEPKSIQEISNAGWFNIRPVNKGPDSVINGINTMLSYKLNLTADSINFIKEKNNYKYRETKEGKMINQPIDAYNHIIDAARYVCMMEFRLKYEDKYKATVPRRTPNKVRTIEDKLKYYEHRGAQESAF